MVDFHQIEAAFFPGVNRAGPVAVLVDQANVFQHIPMQVAGFEHQFMFVHLANLGAMGLAPMEASTAQQLVTAEDPIHGALPAVMGLALIEAMVGLGPPGEAVAGFLARLLPVGLHPQNHVESQHLVIGEEVLTTGAPKAEIAVEPAAMGVVQLDPAVQWARPGIRRRNPAAWVAGLGQNGGSGQRLVTVVIARTATAAKNP